MSRPWLIDEIVARLAMPDCRYVLITGESGAGKTVLSATLAARHPAWLRYFLRRDSGTPLGGSDAQSLMLAIGHQLAAARPSLFEPEKLEVVVAQRLTEVKPGGRVVGVSIQDLYVSPFYKTALRVEQSAEVMGGSLTGVEIGSAVVEPRLLDPSMLQYLGLFDPAALLNSQDPGAQIVVIVDGLDEAATYRGTIESLLDWLEDSPELPSNVRFVLTSRWFARLDSLADRHPGNVERITIDPARAEVTADLRTYAMNLLEESAVKVAAEQRGALERLPALVQKADGNFAYLAAFGRALRGAVESDVISDVDELLAFEKLPAGLASLYRLFVHQIRTSVERLGELEIAGSGGHVLAWEGVGERILGVLSVAEAALDIDQVCALAGLRVSDREARNVLARFRPFLDEIEGGYRLFHASLREYLTGPGSRGPNAEVVIDPLEWHRRIAAYYRGSAASWADVQWSAVDDYGLVYLPIHLMASGEKEGRETVALINGALRSAMRLRFKTDLQFTRLISLALVAAQGQPDPAAAFCDVLFLGIVRSHLKSSNTALMPPVLMLMARLDRAEEAMAYIELMPSGDQQFISACAVRELLLEERRDRADSPLRTDRIVDYALSVPGGGGDFAALYRQNCIRRAAVMVAPIDLVRALRLASLTRRDEAQTRDEVLAAASATAPLISEARAHIQRMKAGQTSALISLAVRAAGDEKVELLEAAEGGLDGEEPTERLALSARLAAAWAPIDQARMAARLSVTLELAKESKPDPSDAASGSWLRALVNAAEALELADWGAAGELLDLAGDVEAGASTSDELALVAKALATRGEIAKSNTLFNRVLAYKRSLRWYGRAGAIAMVAAHLQSQDPARARQLADEALAIVEADLPKIDDFERLRFDSTLSAIVGAFKGWDVDRALKAAGWMGNGTWASGGSPDWAVDRSSALALVGLELVSVDHERAVQLLAEAMASVDSRDHLGRVDAHTPSTYLFRREGTRTHASSQMGGMDFLIYTHNAFADWVALRSWFQFTEPADVLRSILPPAGYRGSHHSWASALASIIEWTAVLDVDTALALSARVSDPGERARAVAGIAGLMWAQGDPRAAPTVDAAVVALKDLPRYEPEINLDTLPQAQLFAYYNPWVRARVDVALRLHPCMPELALGMVQEAGSRYVYDTFRMQLIWNMLNSWSRHVPADGVLNFLESLRNVHRLIGQGDPVICDVLRWRIVDLMAAYSSVDARGVAAEITTVAYKSLAEIAASAAEARSVEEFSDACRKVLDALPQETPRPVCAAAATATWRTLRSVDDGQAHIFHERALAEAQDAIALTGIRSLIGIAAAAADDERRTLVSEALRRLPEPMPAYHRPRLTCDLMRVALSSEDRLATGVLLQAINDGWQQTMAVIDAVAPQLVERFGPGIGERLHSTLCRAERLVAGEGAAPPDHLDGVTFAVS